MEEIDTNWNTEFMKDVSEGSTLIVRSLIKIEYNCIISARNSASTPKDIQIESDQVFSLDRTEHPYKRRPAMI